MADRSADAEQQCPAAEADADAAIVTDAGYGAGEAQQGGHDARGQEQLSPFHGYILAEVLHAEG